MLNPYINIAQIYTSVLYDIGGYNVRGGILFNFLVLGVVNLPPSGILPSLGGEFFSLRQGP